MAKANEPSKSRRRDQSRRVPGRTADGAARPPAKRAPRLKKGAAENQRPDEARAKQMQAGTGRRRPVRPDRRASGGSGASAATQHEQSEPSKARADDGQQGDANERVSEAVRVATGQAVAPPVGGKQDPEALVAAEADAAPGSAASASGPTAAAASTAPVLDEGAAAKAATIGGNTAASSRGASAERGPGRPSAAPPRPPVPGRVPAPDRAVQALAAGSARLQEETLAFARAQMEDLARTGQALATCTSLSAAMTLQIQAASRQFARYVAHGQTLASIGREMWQSLGRPDPDKGR